MNEDVISPHFSFSKQNKQKKKQKKFELLLQYIPAVPNNNK